MKILKIILPLFAILILSCIVFAFTACSPTNNLGDGENGTNNNESPVETVVEITSFDGATIDGEKISMFVEHNIDSVSLSEKVQVGSGCDWKLYYDKLGEFEITTRVAADKNTKKLIDGNNTFYILVSSNSDARSKLYELTIYKSFAAKINYFDGDNLLKTETAYTGHEFEIQYTPSIKGYAFNYWKDYSGEKTQKISIYNDTDLYADKTAKVYTLTFDENNGELLTDNSTKILFDQTKTLPIPNRDGYSFLGWYCNNTFITDNQGNMSNSWKEDKDCTITAQWKANSYLLSIQKSHNDLIASGEGNYDCDSSVSLSATNHLGYDFIGWYDNNNNLITQSATHTFKMPANPITYVAKWEVKEEMKPFAFTSTESDLTINAINDKSVRNISVPEYTTRIASGAFKDCNQLVSLSIPFIGETKNSSGQNSVLGHIFGVTTKYDKNATMQYCFENQHPLHLGETTYYYYYIPKTLKSVTITKLNKMPDNTLGIRKNAFYNCTNLTSITLPQTNSYLNVDDYAFANCSSLVQINNFDEIKSIGKFSFQNCTSIKSINFSSKTSFINESAFNGCTSLNSINFGENILSIGKSAFERCPVSSIILPSKTTTIGERAFYNCKSLETVEVTNNITSIGSSAFYGCKIKNFSIPNKILSIEPYTFANCPLTKIEFPTSVKSIGNCAFINCPIIEVDLSNIATIGDHAFSGCTALSTIILTNNTTSIGSFAFQQCPIESITLPNQITQIGQGTFENCSNLKEIEIPTNVIVIGVDAFNGCTKLTKCSFNGNIKTIGYRAFKGCSSLLSIELPDTISRLETETFKDCTNLQRVKLPKYITQLPSLIFENCISLDCLEIGFIETIQSDALRGCTSLQSINWGNTIRWSDGRQTWWTYEITMDWLTNTKADKIWTKIQ